MTAFRWTGTFYNATYTTSYTATFDDDDPSYQGAADANETVSINGGPFVGTSGQPHVITINFTDPGGTSHVEEFTFFNLPGAGGWYFIPLPGSAFVTGSTLGTYQSHYNGWDYADVTCFVAGTRIETPEGPRRAEDLCAGDLVLSADGRALRLRASLRSTFPLTRVMRDPTLRPIRIRAGALGAGLPDRDLWVSRQHRMLVRGPVVERMFDEEEVFVPAIRLTELPGIDVDDTPRSVTYLHLVFDRHEVLVAEGAPSESFYPGPHAVETLSPAARSAIADLFPELAHGVRPALARFEPPRKRQKALVARLAANGKPVLDDGPGFGPPMTNAAPGPGAACWRAGPPYS